MEDFAAALESYTLETEPAPNEDNVFKGTVVKITLTHVVVDIGFKSEGLVPITEVTDSDGEIKFKPGDEIEVMVQRGENEEGSVLLSHERAQRIRAWEDIEQAYHSKASIMGKVVERVKGGLSVDIGVKAFMGGSQVDVYPVRNLDSLKGQELEVRVIKLNKKRGTIVVSRKAILEEEVSTKRERTLEHLEENAVLTGVIKSLADYGAFVDLGGIDGLLHLTDMSWGRLTHPSDLVHVGDQVQVKVLKLDKDKMRISLGFKQLTPDPWTGISERYPVGARVNGRVLSVTDYGAFVELEAGIEGLIHVREMSWSKRMEYSSKVINPGDVVGCVVINVNPAERRISLGHKQIESNAREKYVLGSIVEGWVRALTDSAAFIEIEDEIEGLVDVSDLNWSEHVKHPSDVLKKGQKVKAVVLGMKPDQRRFSLGIKQLQPDIWKTFFSNHRIGDVVRGKILRLAQFGVFVEIAEGVEGLCHNSEATDSEGVPVKLNVGQGWDFKIIKMNQDEKKVGLSMRAVGEEASRADVEAYKHPASSATTTLGDIINWKRAGNDED